MRYISPLGKYKNQMIFWQIDAILQKYDCDLKTPVHDVPQEAMDEILYGTMENLRISKELVHTSSDYFVTFDGIIKYLRDIMDSDDTSAGQKWAEQFLATNTCPECHGLRLKKESLSYKIGDRNISEVANWDLNELAEWLNRVDESLTANQKIIASLTMLEFKQKN